MVDLKTVLTKIKNTNLAYLWDLADPKPWTLKKPIDQATSHGLLMKDEYFPHFNGSMPLPEGTEGFLYEMPQLYYSKYQRIDDMDYPAPGATILCSKVYYQFCTIVELKPGVEVLVEAFHTVEFNPPKVMGTT